MSVWYNRISATAAAIDGANGVNQQWEQGTSSAWYIELQRFGCDDMTAAVYANRLNLLANGENIFTWGFSKQTIDGGFNNCSNCTPPMQGTGDAFHSTSMFVEAVARCLILMRQSSNFVTYESYFNQIVPKLIRAASWLLKPSVLSIGIRNDMPYTHRRYILAAALAETALLTDDPSLQQQFYSQAAMFAQDGLSLQDSSGFNPEKGGYDSSYNAYGLYQACNYLVVCPDDSLRQQLTNMLSKSFAWQLTRMNPDGSAILVDNTRVTADNNTNEVARSGYDKKYDYKSTIYAFELGSVLLQSQMLHNEAQLVATYVGYLH
ncbi:unnamed protein product [Rotaria sp. Silwood2]|nr:unnamed protein product [Rotaria sp. Silwood2]CAF3290884.1 unnamed protein product [Rotaria sp. Silwood2]CAF3372561.1 unnamed protein product [Rotaria sp. Silwood2]CAF4209847.1 unnamed protein product [Rotaria sp. Silwood2]CAF4295390.1 unnamed protein product [Rotaria sp. Silwood2]